MPQFDTKVGGPELSSIETDLESGNFNISPPFKKESVNARLDSMLSKSIIKL